ncbi:MAG: hypothetical protein AB1414_13655, partial [bacterium]
MIQENNKQQTTDNSRPSYEELRSQLETEQREKRHLQKRLKKIHKRGLRFQDLSFKEAFFGFLKNLTFSFSHFLTCTLSHSISWLK